MAKSIDADRMRDNIVWYMAENAYLDDTPLDVLKMVIEEIDAQPTFDPVIRCRDCAVPHNKWTGCPKLNGLVPPDNFYCAFGVRRDSDGKAD